MRGRGSTESHPWRQARVRALICKFVSTASFKRAEVFPEEDQGLSLQQEVAQLCWWPHPLDATSGSHLLPLAKAHVPSKTTKTQLAHLSWGPFPHRRGDVRPEVNIGFLPLLLSWLV